MNNVKAHLIRCSDWSLYELILYTFCQTSDSSQGRIDPAFNDSNQDLLRTLKTFAPEAESLEVRLDTIKTLIVRAADDLASDGDRSSVRIQAPYLPCQLYSADERVADQYSSFMEVLPCKYSIRVQHQGSSSTHVLCRPPITRVH